MLLALLVIFQTILGGKITFNNQAVADAFIYQNTNIFVTRSAADGAFTLPSLEALQFPLIIKKTGFSDVYLNEADITNGMLIHLEKEANYIGELVEVTSSHSLLEKTKSSLPLVIQPLHANPAQVGGIKGSFSKQAMISVQESSGAGSAPIVSGFRSNKLLYAVNGIRFNNAFFKSGNTPYLSLLNPIYFQNVSIADGAIALLYGSDAIGAAIDYQPTFTAVAAELYSGYNSADQSVYVGGIGYQKVANFAHNYGAYYAKGGDRKSGKEGNSILAYSDDMAAAYVQKNFDYDLTYYAKSSEHRLGFHFGEQRQADDFFRIEFKGSDRYEYEPLQFIQVYENSEFNTTIGHLSTTVYFQRFQEFKYEKKGSDRHYNDEITTLGSSVFLQRKSGSWVFNHGADFIFEESDTHATKAGNPLLSKYPNGAKQWQFGFFSSASIVKENSKWLLGLRYSRTSSLIPKQENTTILQDSFKEFDKTFSQITGSIGYTFQNEKNSYSIVGSTGFRAPNFDDLSKTGEVADNIYSIPNHSIEPERSYSLRVNHLYQGDHFSITNNAFYTDLRDLIDSEATRFQGNETVDIDGETFGFEHNANIQAAYLFGFSTSMDYKMDSWTYMLSASLQEGADSDSDEPLAKIPPLKLVAHASKTLNDHFDIATYLNYMAKQDRLANSDKSDKRIVLGGTPSFTTVDVQVGYHLNTFHLYVQLENLFDQRYRVHASALNGRGRSINLSGKWTL